jgi:signal transduction histidine kinase
MTDYAAISDLWQGLLCLAALLGCLLFFYDLLRSVQLGRKRALLLSAVLLLLSLAHIQVMMMNAFWSPHYPLGIHLKAVPTALFCLALLSLGGSMQYRLRRWSRSHISPMSVKEAFDRLPAGLCYYLPGGLIKLVNTSMDALCQDAVGAPMTDPEGFRRALEAGDLPASLRGGEAPMLRFADGRVYSFAHRLLDTELGPVHELLAMDVSRDCAMNRELEEKQARARELNVRLKALLGSIEYLTMSRELMQLKSELHDRLGQSLLLSRRYLLEPGSVEESEVREAWQKNLSLLENSRPESWQAPYYLRKLEAEALGIRLEISGSLPEESRLIPVVETALSVHVTNVLRHARGNRALVSCRRERGGYCLELTNDGDPPALPLREGGGLGNLRSRVEALGGSMALEASPTFRLGIWLPGSEGGDIA